jgi:rhodanese-related sulfurtransferase
VVVPEISVDELAERLAGGQFLLDVRQPDEYVSGHVPGAVLIPLTEVPASVDQLRAHGPVLVICRSGARSLTAAEFLIGTGLDAVNVAGGTLAWMESGRDVVVSAEPT